MARKHEALRQIVRVRFGDVPEALEHRLAGADGATVNALVTQTATRATVDEL